MIVNQGTDNEYSMDDYLAENMNWAAAALNKDLDMLGVIDGPEGSGKSVLGMQVCKKVDPDFCIDRIAFTPSTFRKAILNAKPGQAVMYDEAYTGLSSRAAMSLINRTLIGMLTEIRQKRLFVLIILPSFFDLDKYVALWRSRFLIHVYMENGFKRGQFRFYNADLKKRLYIIGKKFYDYHDPRPNFIGRFSGAYVLPEADYKQKKRESLTAREKQAEETELRRQFDDELFRRLFVLGDKISNKTKCEILQISEPTFYRRLTAFNAAKE